MTTVQTPIAVGAPDPEHKTSPILDEYDEDFPILAQQIEELPVCYFNSVAYDDGTFVCIGSGELLRCEKGIWVQEGSCDPDNPWPSDCVKIPQVDGLEKQRHHLLQR